MTPKERLREKYKKIRAGLPLSYRESAAKKIAEAFLELPQVKEAGVVGIYMSTGSEVDTFCLFKELLSLKKTLAIPKVDHKKSKLNFFRIERGLEDCHIGFYNIWEPNPGCPPVLPSKIDLMAVPGIAFDAAGYRIGYGKGFYDKCLSASPNLLSIGLSYEETLLPSLPHGKLDRRVSCVVTENKTLWIGFLREKKK